VCFFAQGDACQSQGWDLITNRQWMTIARQIEANPNNWIDGVVGSSQPTGGLIIGNSNSGVPLDGFNELSGLNRRTFYLSTGEYVWDFSGNLWNWVDVLEDGSGFSGNICSGQSMVYRGFVGDGVNACFFSGGWTQNNSTDKRFEVGPMNNYNANEHRVGMIFPRNIDNRFAARGAGFWSWGSIAGVFALALSEESTFTGLAAGFRCVANIVN
jgi:hypothetical protein